MVTAKLNLSMTEPSVRQIYAKQGDTGRVLDITLDQTPEDGTLRILRPDGVEVTSEAVTGGEVESGGTFDSLTEADVTELTVGIEPVQDLNGYGKPWVGGAGKNKLKISATNKTIAGITYTINEDGSFYIDGTITGGTAWIHLCNNDLFRTLGLVSGQRYILSQSISNKAYIYIENTNNVHIYDAVDGSIEFTYNGETNWRVSYLITGSGTFNHILVQPMIRLATETDPTFAPYSNICPITGHDEVRVTRTGNFYVGADYDSGDGYVDNGFLKADNTITENSAYYVTRFFPITPDTDCLVNVVNYYNAPSICFYDSSKSFIRGESFSNRIRFTVHTPSSCAYARMSIHEAIKSQMGVYDNYSTYTPSLGQTVYGGTLDMVSGVLNVTYGYKDIDDFATLTSWTSAGGLYVAEIAGTYTANAPSVCSMLEQKTVNQAWSSTTECYAIEGSKIRIYTTETTLANFKTKFAQLQIAYSLAEPVTYQLTAQQIKTLVGTNNVWASSGDIINIKFTYGGLLSELPSDATSVVGKCYCDVEQNGVSSMPFTLNVKKNERES